MSTTRRPPQSGPRDRIPLIAHVPSRAAGQAALYADHNNHTWRMTLGQADRPSAHPRPTQQGSRRGLINDVPSNAAGQPALYSDRNHIDWRRRHNTPAACPLLGPARPQEPLMFNGVESTFDPTMWREEQRTRDPPVAPLNAAEINNSE